MLIGILVISAETEKVHAQTSIIEISLISLQTRLLHSSSSLLVAYVLDFDGPLLG